MGIPDRYHDYILVYTDRSQDGDSVTFASVIPSDTVIFMRLPNLTSIFSIRVCSIVKALEQIKLSSASKYIYIYILDSL